MQGFVVSSEFFVFFFDYKHILQCNIGMNY